MIYVIEEILSWISRDQWSRVWSGSFKRGVEGSLDEKAADHVTKFKAKKIILIFADTTIFCNFFCDPSYMLHHQTN